MHKKKSQAAGGGSPPTLRPNFNCKKGSVTAAAAACMPRRGDCGGSPLTLRPNFNCKKGSVTAGKPPVCPAGEFLLVRIYGDSFLYNLRVILESYSADETRTLFFFASFFLFSKESGGSPLTLRPNFKSKKSSVTADKPPVHPAGGFLLVRIYGDSFLYNLRVILESYSTDETRTLFFFCFFFSFQQRKKEA